MNEAQWPDLTVPIIRDVYFLPTVGCLWVRRGERELYIETPV